MSAIVLSFADSLWLSLPIALVGLVTGVAMWIAYSETEMKNRKRLAIEASSGSRRPLREGDRRLLKLLQLDAACADRAHGRCVLGEPQRVVELLNAPVEEIEDL